MTKLENIDWDKIDQALERVGRRELSDEDLTKFAIETLEYEAEKIEERTEMFENEEIEEKDINNFDFYSDGYRFGIHAVVNNENLLTLDREKTESGLLEEVKVKFVDEEQTRVRFVLITRRGYVTVFTTVAWFDAMNDLLEKSQRFVFSGGLTVQYKNKRTQKFEKDMREGEEYYDLLNFTFNLWQMVQIYRKGKIMNLRIVEKPSEE